MPTVEHYIYIIFEQCIKITKYKFTVKAFIIHKITRKKLFETASDLPRAPGPMHLPPPPPPPNHWGPLSQDVRKPSYRKT